MHRAGELVGAGTFGIQHGGTLRHASGRRLAGRPPARHGARTARIGVIHRRLAERAPQALERKSIGIQHKHPAVPITVGNEQFVGLGPDKKIAGLVDRMSPLPLLTVRPPNSLMNFPSTVNFRIMSSERRVLDWPLGLLPLI